METTTETTTETTSAPTSAPGELPLERLEAVIWEGSANLTAAEHDWLLAVAEFDRRRGWERWECHSCAHWLSWQVGLDIRAAREKVRVGHALVRFPAIAAAMATGRLSYSKVRAITRIATPATEVDLVELALAGTTNQVERLVSAYQRADPGSADREAKQWARRGLWHEVQPDGTVAITLRLPAEAGAAFLSAVEGFVPPAELLPDGTRDRRAARRADGAVAMAEAARANSSSSEPRYLVTLHADLEALEGREGRCEIQGHGDSCELPIGVPAATALRMLCDCDVEAVVTRHGEPIGISKRSKVVRGRLRRLVLARDRGCCQFPGCDRRAGVDVHHLRHRLHGGSNELPNLTVLCRFHHHRVHEGGWTSRRTDDGLVFTAPDGREVTQRASAQKGDATAVHSHGRRVDDGRSQWNGDSLDLDHALIALFSAERENSPGSASARSRPPRPTALLA
jgi:hypothetical protein